MNPTLSPSLWRTCRVLANRTRLKILGELFEHPGLCVSDIVMRFRIPGSVASRYLRELNARGLLAAVRVAKWVRYRPCADKSVPQAEALLEALQETFRKERKPVERIFRQVTAFTHPRRSVIVSAVGRGCTGQAELVRATGISRPALVRHVRKLKRRGFLLGDWGTYRLASPKNPLAQTLLRLAQKTP